MRFRTEIEPQPRRRMITKDTKMVLLGSCFTTNIGERLSRDGFNCLYNPLGPLFNPWSLSNTLKAAISGRIYGLADLTESPRGFHCLDYASRYSGADADAVIAAVNGDLKVLRDSLIDETQRVLIITLGSAYLYKHLGVKPVGNCQKFAPESMVRTRLTVEQCVQCLQEAIVELPENTKVILTVSPVRHLDEGLHGNTIVKSILHLACETLADGDRVMYFPAYEIIIDDLRDYRFYADDLKHPSQIACDYIYEHFCNTFMDDAALAFAAENRRKAASAAHRSILN